MKSFVATCLLAFAAAATAQGKPETVGTPEVYKTVDAQALHAWVSQPTGKPTHTAIVFFHGGGWTMGSPSQFYPQAKALSERGMLVVNVEYRLIAKPPSTETPQKCLEDAKSAIRWVRSHAKEFDIDPNRIVASGGSAGGYLAAATGLVPGWDDPTDDLKVSAKPNVLVLYFPVVSVTANSSEERFGQDLSKYSPNAYITKDMPPTIIEAGAADKLVSPASLKDFKSKCDAVGAKCVLNFYAGQPHGFANKEPYNSLTTNEVMHFLESLGYLPKDTPDVPVPQHTKS